MCIKFKINLALVINKNFNFIIIKLFLNLKIND